MHKEIKSRQNLGNACDYSVQVLSFHLLCRSIKVNIFRVIILPLVLYGCETWSVTLREEHRLRVFENRVLRRIFGPKRDEVTGERRKLHSGELHNLYSVPFHHYACEIKENEVGRTCGTHGRERKVYKVLVGKPEGKRPLKRPRHKW
jgi:hypothetical protein